MRPLGPRTPPEYLKDWKLEKEEEISKVEKEEEEGLSMPTLSTFKGTK